MATYRINGETVTVKRGTGPSADAYLYAWIRGKEYYLMTITPGLTRADVQKRLEDHPQLQRSTSGAE